MCGRGVDVADDRAERPVHARTSSTAGRKPPLLLTTGASTELMEAAAMSITSCSAISDVTNRAVDTQRIEDSQHYLKVIIQMSSRVPGRDPTRKVVRVSRVSSKQTKASMCHGTMATLGTEWRCGGTNGSLRRCTRLHNSPVRVLHSQHAREWPDVVTIALAASTGNENVTGSKCRTGSSDFASTAARQASRHRAEWRRCGSGVA
jgi:hypothetical protein